VISAAQVNSIPKRHGATSPLYALSTAQSAVACASDSKCTLPLPPAPPPPPAQPLKFVVLNGDFNQQGTAWYDLDGSPALPFVWDDAWVTMAQLEWLAEQLDAAKTAGQKVIVFVHYRLDGGPGGPVNCSATTPCGLHNNRAWVDDCTLKNAAIVRDILEGSGVVLATFSGHDHVPIPAYTASKPAGGVLYFTHQGLVEGPYPASNAYSTVDVLTDCTVVVTGYHNASSVTHPGPPGCKIATV
jgi:hypothetical protein